ncbi:superoxide dismutase [Coprinopsis sp. MPI-PUGE-AT-0042]|nr:superoxide dismutase [Coprinopsis sp. MPI-PUGE-AT-0042]
MALELATGADSALHILTSSSLRSCSLRSLWPSYATFWYSPFASPVHQKAVVVLKASPNSTANGFITGNLTGLDANALRGFHVHGGCATAGPHFNPGNKTHVRHSNAEGTVILNFKDSWISLNGPNSLTTTQGQDDLGKGGQNDSLTTGHAGARSACGGCWIQTDTFLAIV